MDEPDGNTPIIVPLSINSVTIYYPCCKLTRSKFEDDDVPRIDFTVEAPYWDPLDRNFAEREGDMTDFRGALVREVAMERGPNMVISKVSLGTAGIDVSSDDNSGLMLESNSNVRNEFTTVAMPDMEMHKIMCLGTSISRRSLEINNEMFQTIWGIHPAIAKNTVECTTQRGVRISFPHSSLTKRIQKNDMMLRYNRLPCNAFVDTLISGMVSKRGNKYAEVFATGFCWARSYPMKKKSNAHEAVSLMFQRTAVPDKMTVDGSKEQVLDHFQFR